MNEGAGGADVPQALFYCSERRKKVKTQNLCMVIHARDPTESDTRKMNVTHSQLQQNYIKNKRRL